MCIRDRQDLDQSDRPRGLVQAVPVQLISTSPHPHSIIVDPSNRYLFTPSLGGDAILQFRFDAVTGLTTPNVPPVVETRKGAGPRHLIFHPHSPFAYGTNELNATVGAYRLDAGTGTLTLIDATSALPPEFEGHPPFAAADLHTTPDGRFLYASERVSHTLAGFEIDAVNGTLVSIGNFPTEQQPRSFNIDPCGRYLLAVGQMSNSMTSYAINRETGVLIPRHRFAMGKNPNWVEIIGILRS